MAGVRETWPVDGWLTGMFYLLVHLKEKEETTQSAAQCEYIKFNLGKSSRKKTEFTTTDLDGWLEGRRAFGGLL